MQNIETLKALAYRGHPLAVEITLEDGWEDDRNAGERMYSKTIRGSTGYGTRFAHGSRAGDLAEAEEELAGMLKFYPDGVMVNGSTIETTEWNDMATLEVTTFVDHEGRTRTTEMITPGGNRPRNSRGNRRGTGANTMAGGVLIYVFDNHQEEHTYHVDMEGEHPHWNLAKKVVVLATNVVTTQELDRMTQQDLEDLTKRMRNGEEPEIAQRRAEQIRRTMEHPDAPPKYQGEIYRYLNTGAGGDDLYFSDAAPVIAHAPPVSFPDIDPTVDNPEIVSIIDAMYASDQGMVPVQLTSEQHKRGLNDQIAKVTDYFVETGEERETPSSYIGETDSINFLLDLGDQEETTQIRGRVYMTYAQSGRKVLYTKEMTDQNELAEVMVRAFFYTSDDHDWDEVKDEIRNLDEEFSRDVSAAMGNPEAALQETMEKAANMLEIGNEIKIPRERIAATSRDGQFTITTNPQG